MSIPIADRVEAASTLAVVIASIEPLLFLSSDLTVIAASTSFCAAFDVDPATIVGKPLAEIGAGEWGMAKLTSLLNATASGSAEIEAYEIDLVRPEMGNRKLIVHAQMLADGQVDNIRLLLAITDVTDARAESQLKDDLIREKAILVQEVQHRVANSLQIIASVLMQSARRVQSEEARGYLQNAHHRVMSIAAVQRQLAVASDDLVVIRTYLTQLCHSLGASMIADPDRLSMSVTADDSVVSAAASVSLGLIVTELVINALKHAFPDQSKGTILVSYQSDGTNWTLSVTDDGIGIATGPDAPKTGLGTGIVEALTKNLDSEVVMSDAKPGTAVTITHLATRTSARDLVNAA